MKESYNETNFEQAVIETFQGLGYEYHCGYDIPRNRTDVLLEDVLRESLGRINALPSEAIEEAIYKVRNVQNDDLTKMNQTFTGYLQNGVTVKYQHDGESFSKVVDLIDYRNPHNNDFRIVNQYTVIQSEDNRRPDVILFINGLPLVVMELKSPTRETADIHEAYTQMHGYQRDLSGLFVYNQICVLSDFAVSKLGTITSTEERYMEWRTEDFDKPFFDFNTLCFTVFEKSTLLDILQNFICYDNSKGKLKKVLAGYHQYYAVKKSIASTVKALQADGKIGVFWHTQGSGKSLSMVFYTHLLSSILDNPTVVVITDRNDLDDQLFGQFQGCQNFLRHEPIQAESRENLKELLVNRQAGGIVFTTMQKFEEETLLSDRRDVIVISDEVQRGHYGLTEKVNTKTGKITTGTALKIRESLPNASYIGFTGTPIELADRNTKAVFGDYIDIYDMTQSVKDGATRPIYYESRVVKLKLDDDILQKLDEEYSQLENVVDTYTLERLKKEHSKLESILGADDTIDSLCRDIVSHYEDSRQYVQTGKAMVVAYSRDIAYKIYKKLLEIRPNWNEKLAVVMTSNAKDSDELKNIIGTKAHKKDLEKDFKDDESALKIVIVVDMWLTGFDVPSLSTMYVYKYMLGHNLMQTIARVNRVYKDKEGGLIVDYIGIASALKIAMKQYTKRDQDNFGNLDIAKSALPTFNEKLQVCRELFYGFDYSQFFEGSNTDRANLIAEGVNFMSSVEKTVKNFNREDELSLQEIFFKNAMMLKQALSLCKSIVKEHARLESVYFEAVRITLVKITTANCPVSPKEINGRINELLKQSVQSSRVLNLFSDVKSEFSIFDSEFLLEISKIKQKNLSIELLKKLIKEQISIYRRTNLMKSEKFSNLLTESVTENL